ncbi:MAG: tRNA (guanine-N1)-methyltransferase [Cyanobacteria bacterium P01_F01_bin.42]
MSGHPSAGWLQEGKATFRVGAAFYRARSARTRDLGTLAAVLVRRRLGRLTVLDAMTGCGVRSLRYALEAEADVLWVNDGNPELRSLIEANLALHLSPSRYRISSLSAQRLLAQVVHQGDRFDWLDLDCFGSPAASLSLAIAATTVDGCLYLTATDGKSLAGQQSSAALKHFGSYTRHHPAVHEQGVRVLIGLAAQQARHQGLDILPLFSLFCGQTYRVLLRLLPRAAAGDHHCGFLGYCHHCGQFYSVPWRKLNSIRCSLHDGERPLVLSGPMWLGPIHDSKFLDRMSRLAQEWKWSSYVPLLQRMQTEAHLPPYYVLLSEIGRRGKMDIPARDKLIQSLTQKGYATCRSSIVAQAIKTHALMPVILDAAREIQTLK